MARRKLRVLYVEGNGKRGSFTRQSWRQSDIGVGLKRSLPMALLDEIDMRFTSHGHIFDAAHQVDLTDMGEGRFRVPAHYSWCSCCRPGWGYHLVPGLLDCLPEDWCNWAEACVIEGLKDVKVYTGSSVAKAAVIKNVGATIEDVRPQIVIAHSLGSIVALEALATSSAQPQLLLTLGAPLSWPRFVESWSPLARRWFKSRNNKWVNVLDVSDFVTASRVPPKSPYVGVRNIVVNNDHFTPFHRRDDWLTDTHKASEYLGHPVISDEIRKISHNARYI